MKIYTRRGDAGSTDLFAGPRVRKDDLRVEAYGTVDELSSVLGLCASASEDEELIAWVTEIQSRLLDLGAELASPDPERRRAKGIDGLQAAEVEILEGWIDQLEKELSPLRRFILPRGTPAASAFHFARTVCRRAERRVVALNAEEPLGGEVLTYLNRLSDLLFVLARTANHRAGVADVEWKGRPG